MAQFCFYSSIHQVGLICFWVSPCTWVNFCNFVVSMSEFISLIYCHILITPSQPQLNTMDGSRGCQAQAMAGPLSCALNFWRILRIAGERKSDEVKNKKPETQYQYVTYLCRFQSQKKSFPFPSPLTRN